MPRRPPRAPLAEDDSPPRRWVTRSLVTVLVLSLGGAVWFGARDVILGFVQPRCRATALGQSVTYTPEQMHHAATITAVAMRRGLPARAATIAVATSIQESKLRNITYGDRDSLGLFQQRPSQGWGTAEQILDPVHATNAFYDALVKIDGYGRMPITKVAQAVQRSAYPEAYADHEQEGRILASALSGYSPGGLGCRLDDPTGTTDGGALRRALRREVGVTARPRGGDLVVTAGTPRSAWAVGAWAVAQAQAHELRSVTVGDRQWTRTRAESGWSWHPADAPQGTTTVVLATS